ncbi:M56 family metallopeptidase [Pseudomonas sp. CGJS7]|uniref:M56 family metallopeptidase n=1 Tax=Pseudomonas sp. CGJS7 TaxID=3109348 RepID=UPI00300B3F02
MNHVELIGLLAETSAAMSAATVLVLLLRGPLLRWFGAGLAYASWWLVPLTTLAVLLPAAPRPLVPGNWIVVAGGAVPTTAPVPHSPNADPWLALSVLWLIGAVAMTLLTVWRQRRFQRGLGPLRPRGDGTHQAGAQAGLPAAFGLLRPKIVVPDDFEQRYDAEQQALIRAHEATHIARGDLGFNALAMALRCLYWFNPLLHYAAARFRHDQELSCDARVIARHPQARRAYAQAMFTTQLAAQVTPLGCHWGSTHPLRERIEMLKRETHTRPRRVAGALLILALGGLAGAAAWAAQPSLSPRERQITLDTTLTMSKWTSRMIAMNAAEKAGLQIVNPQALDDRKNTTMKFDRVPVATIMELAGMESGTEPRFDVDRVTFVPSANPRIFAGNRYVGPDGSLLPVPPADATSIPAPAR